MDALDCFLALLPTAFEAGLPSAAFSWLTEALRALAEPFRLSSLALLGLGCLLSLLLLPEALPALLPLSVFAPPPP